MRTTMDLPKDLLIGRGGSPARANRQSSRRTSRCNAAHYGESISGKMASRM